MNQVLGIVIGLSICAGIDAHQLGGCGRNSWGGEPLDVYKALNSSKSTM